LRFPATIHADWSATVRSILFIFIFLGFIDDSHAQSPHWSIGTRLSPAIDERSVVCLLAEFNHTVLQSEQRVIFSNSYIHARVMLGTALTHDDITSDATLTSKYFYAQSFRLGLPSVI
jgi:hypothetical protein